MLTIQPNVFNNYTKTPNFGNRANYTEYADYEEISDLSENERPYISNDCFDIAKEKTKAKHELDLWEQTKDNLDSIAKTTESVPVLRKGTQVLSGLISVAIGWGGLRWGTVGTLEVLSKIGKTSFAQGIKRYSGIVWNAITGTYKNSKKYIANTDWFKSLARKAGEYKQSALNTNTGRKLTEWKDAVKGNSLYQKVVKAKQDTVTYVKKLNPKRIFVETMGVAGGGTAAINTIGGKSVDGTRHNVEQDDNGNFYIDGRIQEREYGDVA